ncbi:MAG: glycoside hydrolase family 25 protein, partial [Prevotella sp.]
MKKLLIVLACALCPFLASAQEGYYIQCEDTCNHIHGIDISHYQGQVFWEVIGENSKMAYVYIKASEGGDRIDPRYERNIQLAHQYGLKVGSYHFFRPKTNLAKQLENFMTQCRPGDQDLIPMIGPIKGEISMAPMITAVELTFNPKEAMKIAKINIHSCAPWKLMELSTF